MRETNQVLGITRPLNVTGIRYAVTGSVASMVYGEPRMTHDVDIVVDLSPGEVESFQLAFDTEEYYCPPEEVLRVEIARAARGHFNVIHQADGFKADFYPAGRDPLQRWALANRRDVRVHGEPVYLAPPEYVILMKLQYYKEGGSDKHARDIRGILNMDPGMATSAELLRRLQELGLVGIWEKVQCGE
jgi:hypothetical protein